MKQKKSENNNQKLILALQRPSRNLREQRAKATLLFQQLGDHDDGNGDSCLMTQASETVVIGATIVGRKRKTQ